MSNETENKNYQLTKRGETVKDVTHIAVRVLGGAALAIPVAIGVNAIAEGPDVVYTGTQEVPADYGTNLTEMVQDHVEYDSNEVPTPKIVEYVIDTNQAMLKDGLDAGEKPILPVSAEREQ